MRTLIQKHVDQYDSINLLRSFRGIAVALIVVSFILFLLSLLNVGVSQDIWGALIVLIILAPFLYFILKGKTWAMILMIVIISLPALLALIGGAYQGIVWNLVIIYLLVLSIQVEKNRKH